MAQARTADDAGIMESGETPMQAPEKKGNGKGLVIVLLALVLVAGGGFAAWQFLLKPAEAPADGADAKPVAAKPYYLEITPNFVVNLENPDLMRYLQLDLQVMTHDEKTLGKVEAYMPEIRNNLLLMFAQQKYEDLLSRPGKEALQKAALDEINNVLKAHSDEPAIEAVLFTSFVMQ